MTPSNFNIIICLVCCCIVASAASVAACAAHCDHNVSTAADSPSLHELSKVSLVGPIDLELNPAASPAASCSSWGSPNSSTFTSSSSNLRRPRSADSPPVLTPTTKAQGTSSSTDIATTLAIAVLVNNLMPVPLPAHIALATTAAAWLWLAFNRLLPWLPQSTPPSHAATAATAASGSDAVAAAAGLSPAATAASAAGGVGGDPSTRWWQHALLVLELLMGNTMDSVLLMGLLLLPVIVLKRWLSGTRIWRAVPGLSTAELAHPASADPASMAAAATTSLGDNVQDAGTAELTGCRNTAMRSSVDGLGAQLQSAGTSAGRLAKAMRNIGSNARRPHDSHSASGSSNSGNSSPHAASHNSRRSSPASSSTGSMVSPEQSLQPNTPPLLFVARPDSPLAVPVLNVRVAGPVEAPHSPAPQHSSNNAGASARSAATAVPPAPKGPRQGTMSALPRDSSTSSSSDDIRGGVGQSATPADTTGQQGRYAAEPTGSRSDSGSNAGQSASLNLGAVGTIRTLSTRGPVQPMYPTRALYNSPLETVVVSCKLANTATNSRAGQANRTTAYAGPAPAAQAVGMGPLQGAATRVEVPLSPTQASLAGGGHGSISVQRELRAVVEAAVRQAVAASNVAVLSTTVTSFPGCVHVVATANLTTAALEAMTGAGSDAAVQGVGSEGTDAPESLTARVVWEQVVQQILGAQADVNTSAGPSSPRANTGSVSSTDGDQGAARVLAREGLYLKHLLVQDTAGNVHYLWVSPDAVDAAPAGAEFGSTSAQSSSAYSATPEPVSPAASSSSRASSRAVHHIQHVVSVASNITISSFALPTDAAETQALAGRLQVVPGTPTSAAAAASKLLLPPGLADALTAASCGLRVVITGNTQGSATASGGPTDTDPSAPAHLLADVTMWPNSSSWPAGHLRCEFDLKQLLPEGMSAAELCQQFGPVLTVNIVASTGQQRAGSGSMQSAAAMAGSSGAGSDTMHLQNQGTSQQEGVRSTSGKLHEEIARLVRRLGGSSTTTEAVATAEGPARSAIGTSTGPAQTATTAGPGSDEQPAADEEVSVGEHLLFQLPLMLLPSAACMELNQLQQRMTDELDGNAATAARRHVLPLINDVAAAFNMDVSTVRDQLMLSTEQKNMLKQVLQYMSDQGLDTLAATVCSHLGVQDVSQVICLQGRQQSTDALPATTQDAFVVHEIAPSYEPTYPSFSALATPADTQQASEISGVFPTNAAAATTNAAAATTRHAHEADRASASSKQAAEALEQASAASEQAAAAQRAAAATESALQVALQQISALSAAAAEASRQAADAQAAAAAATQRAAAVEEQAERQRALQLISSPAGAPASGNHGVGIWGLFGGNARAVAAARAAGTALLGGVLRAAEPPMVPQEVSRRDVLLGFEDERLEVQYRRMKALQCRSIDRAAFLMQLFRQAVYVWRIARLMYVSAGTGLSLVLLCKYEAVVLLPYIMMLLTPDFYIYHRHLLLCLSQIAAALTVGMIATTEVYRNEWSALLQRPGPTLLARPSMMLFWYYLLMPVLQQQTLPEQALSCVAQLTHSLLIYVFILKGTTSLTVVVPLLLAASGLSFAVSYVADAWTRRQAVAGARRSLMGPTG